MNSRQYEFVKYPILNSMLIGAPGSGKTTTIISKIQTHFDSPKNFILLTFSRQACTDFITKAAKNNLSGLINETNVKTIHSLARSIVLNSTEDANDADTFDKKNISIMTVVTYAYHLLMSVSGANKSDITFNNFTDCKVIFVDEAQDLSDIQYKFVLLLAKILNVPTVLVGDPNQNIYQFQGGSDKYLMNHPGHAIYLVDNYRSTVEIVNFINPFRVWNNLPPLVAASGRHGPKPSIYVGNIEKLIDNILQDIIAYRNAGGSFEDIAIISPVKKCKPSHFNNELTYANIGLQLLANSLHHHHLPFVQHYDLSQGDESRKNAEAVRPGHINLLTAHGSKGLEFNKVYVLNFHFKTQGKEPTKDQYEEHRYLWYVALSRAKDDMRIYVDEDKDVFPTLSNVDRFLYDIRYITKDGQVIDDADESVKMITPQFKEDDKSSAFQITESIKNLKEEEFYDFEKLCKYTTDSVFFFRPGDIMTSPCYEYDKYCTLYGRVAESVFNYYYSTNYIKELKEYIQCTIDIPCKYAKVVASLRQRVAFTKDVFTMAMLSDFKNDLNEKEKKLYDYLVERSGHLDKPLRIRLQCNIPIQITDTIAVIEKIDQLIYYRDKLDSLDAQQSFVLMGYLFDIQLFNYQYEHEAAYIMSSPGGGDPFGLHKESFSIYAKNIKNYAQSLVCTSAKLQLQKRCDNPYMPLYGICDIVSLRPNGRNTIVELKFSQEREISSKYMLQLLMYYNNLYPDWGTSESISIEVWNLYWGIKTRIHFKPFDKWAFLNMVSTHMLDGAKLKNLRFAYDIKTANSWCFIEPYLNMQIMTPNVPVNKIVNDILLRCHDPIFVNSHGNGSKPLVKSKGPKNKVEVELNKAIINDFDIRKLLNIDSTNSLTDMYTIVTGKLPKRCDTALFDAQLMAEMMYTANLLQ